MLSRELWDQAVEFHGHKCPGLAIGFKAVEGAISELGLSIDNLSVTDEELVCVSENDACGVDAVQALLGCTVGKGNLVFRIRGKMAFSFFCRETGQSVRLCLNPSVGNELSREEYQEYLLSHSYDDLFVISKPSYPLPEKARRFPSENCSICGESTAEYFLRVQSSNLVCTDCYDVYDREGF